ncbi:hypothetical protein GCM10022200_05390 [Microbacterium awajiense]|uniref:PucR family transcriptional regulator n=1 Tax=Microbacterium awajiense TaxID=415214 RepID=A0ABP7A6L8_9MICO
MPAHPDPVELAARIRAALAPAPIPVVVGGVSCHLVPRLTNSPEALSRLHESPSTWARLSLVGGPAELDDDEARDLLVEHSDALLRQPDPLTVRLGDNELSILGAVARSERHLATLEASGPVAWARAVTDRRLRVGEARALVLAVVEAAEARAA